MLIPPVAVLVEAAKVWRATGRVVNTIFGNDQGQRAVLRDQELAVQLAVSARHPPFPRAIVCMR
jgi:hypothetical protein